MNSGLKRSVLLCLLIVMLISLCSCGGSSSHSSYRHSKPSPKNDYDMPNSSDKSVSDYIKRVDPDLWDEMESNWN